MTPAYDLGRPPGRDELLAALHRSPPRLDLAALAIARVHHPELDATAALARLDALAARVVATPGDRLEALISVLGREEAFHGDREQYDAPENSCLDLVLTRHKGLPILLSVLFMEVGWRAGVELVGLALPGHFMVARGEVVLDPFDGGARLTRDDCTARVRRVVPDAELTERDFAPASAEAICWRMLNNLRGTYQRRGDHERSLHAVDLMLALRPDHPTELRFRAQVLTQLGAFRAALADLRKVLAGHPPDEARLTKLVRGLEERVGLLH